MTFDRRRNGYACSHPEFRLSFPELGEEELIALLLAEGVPEQYAGTPYAADLASACREIALGISARSAGGTAASQSLRVSAAAAADPAIHRSPGAALRLRGRLKIRCNSASRDEEADREVDPCHMAKVDGDFYLVAFCHRRGCLRMFAPARIRAAEPTGATFDPPADFRIEDDLAGSFAVLRGGVGESHRVSWDAGCRALEPDSLRVLMSRGLAPAAA